MDKTTSARRLKVRLIECCGLFVFWATFLGIGSVAYNALAQGFSVVPFVVIGLQTWLLLRWGSMLVAWYTSPLWSIPGPPPTGFFSGNVDEIIREPPYMPQLRWAKKYGQKLGLVRPHGWFNEPKVLLLHPEALKRVMVSNAQNYEKHPRARQFLTRAVGHSLLTSEGKEHARQRRAISPAFHFSNLHRFVPIFLQQAEKLAAKWDELLDASPSGKITIDAHKAMCKVTLDIIGLSAFTYNFNSIVDEEDEIYNAYNDVFATTDMKSLILNALIPGFRLLPTKANVKAQKGLATVRNKVAEIVGHRRRQLSDMDEQSAAQSLEKSSSLLDLLIQSKDPATGNTVFDEKELTDQIMTFMVAGHETTAVALCWALYVMALHPEKEEELRGQLEASQATDSEQAGDWQRLKDNAYLQAFIKEVLRLYPSAPITTRVALNDDELCGVRIPAGTQLFISPGVLGRLPAVWGDDADDFRPARHMDTERKKSTDKSGKSERRGGKSKVNGSVPSADHAYAWLPFLVGSRSCIGQRFALMELACILSVLVPRFKLRLVPGQNIRPKLTVTMRPYPSLMMEVERA